MNDSHDSSVKIRKPAKRSRSRMARRKVILGVVVVLLIIGALIGGALVVPVKDGEPLVTFGDSNKVTYTDQGPFDGDAEELYESDELWRKELEKKPLPANASAVDTAEYNESMIAANKIDNPKEAIRLYESMINNNMKPTLASSVQVADAYIAVGNKDGARAALDKAEETVRADFSPAEGVTLDEKLADIDTLRKEAGL